MLVLSVACNRRRETHTKHPPPNDDVRENIINYADEGGGEDDMTAFDIKPLQIPVEGNSQDLSPKIQCPHLKPGPVVEEFMEKYKRADRDINVPPFDDLRNYAYEGPGSVAGSLSSLPSGTDDNDHTFDYLEGWGPRFHKLGNIYRQDSEESGEDNSERR
uniref:Cadherin Y-type LIR-motif domain-containing protein n=1 Tax=Timema bartmani TaxID=61472 RepID=A0A7R9EWM0_9NEOP|nr:unnamed protein product [Timema bartmani]